MDKDILSKDELSKKAYKCFINKDYKNARDNYILLLENYSEELDDNYRTNRNTLNNLIVSSYNLLLENSDNNTEYINDIFKFLEDYLDIAKNDSDVELKRWALNILLELFENIIDVILIKHSNIDNEEKDNLIRDDAEKYFNKFIEIFTPIFRKELFFDIFLKKIYAERRNFERKGDANQNIKNVKILSDVFIDVLIPFKNEYLVMNNLANIYILLADLAYYNQGYKKNKKELEAIRLLEISLNYNETMFAKSRIKQLNDINFAEQRISLFRHDMVSKMSTYKDDLKSLLQDDKSENEKIKIIEGNIIKINYLLSLYEVIDGKSPNYNSYQISNIVNEFDKNITDSLTIESNFQNKIEVDIDYFRIILENLLKNSKDAYDRNNIWKKEQRKIFISVNLDDNMIIFKDLAGGIKENILVDNRLFETHVSEKNIAQNHGLGLSLVKSAINRLGGEISVENYEIDEKKGAKFIIKNIFLEEEGI